MQLSAAFVLAGAALSCLGCGSSGDDVADDSREGTIVVTQGLTGPVPLSYSISANWLPPVAALGCSLTTAGACIVVSCGATTTSASTTSLDAGPLVFTSNSDSVTLTANGPAKEYESSSGSSGLASFFAPGDMVTVSGQGGPDLPPFSAVSVTAPTETTLLQPCAAGVCPVLDRTQDLLLSWSSQGSGSLSIYLGAAGQTNAASCLFDLSAGMGDVPADVLAALPSTDALSLEVQAINDQAFMLGGLPTTFLVAETIFSGDSPAAGP